MIEEVHADTISHTSTTEPPLTTRDEKLVTDEIHIDETAVTLPGLDDKSEGPNKADRNDHTVRRDNVGEAIREPHHWNAALGTLGIVLAQLAMTIVYLLCIQKIGKWAQFSSEERELTKLALQFSFAAGTGVVARWLTLAAAGIPKPTSNLVEYMRRWIADVVSSALIVTVVLIVAQSITIQVGKTTVALSEADTELLMALAFVLGYFVRRARTLLYGISHISFLQKEEHNKVEEQKKGKSDSYYQNRHKNGNRNNDLLGAPGDW